MLCYWTRCVDFTVDRNACYAHGTRDYSPDKLDMRRCEKGQEFRLGCPFWLWLWRNRGQISSRKYLTHTEWGKWTCFPVGCLCTLFFINSDSIRQFQYLTRMKTNKLKPTGYSLNPLSSKLAVTNGWLFEICIYQFILFLQHNYTTSLFC